MNMINTIQQYIDRLCQYHHLTQAEAEHAFQIILNGGATPAQMAAFLVALRMKGETVDELIAGAKVLRAKAVTLKAPTDVFDTCGTGGDAQGTLNISTAVAIVLAACGVKVAKHGNRSFTSRSGSSDVLSALGVNVNANIETLEKALEKCNISFLMAPRFHTCMRHVAPVRLELGMRTIFNLLGPLSNPTSPKRQILGVYDRNLLEPLAYVLKELGVERAWVVHGSDGMDELTTTGESYVAELVDGHIHSFVLTPEEAGLHRVTLDDLKGRGPEYNAKQLQYLLAGTPGPYRDIVLFNAAAALIVAGKAGDFGSAMQQAAEVIDNGTARQTLANLVAITSGIIPASMVVNG